MMRLDRRTVIVGLLASSGLCSIGARAAASAASAASAAPWSELERVLPGKLIRVMSPLIECARSGGAGADQLFRNLKNPFFLSDTPGLTQTLGWVDAWRTAPSAYAVEAESAADVAEAIRFATRHGVRLIVRGGGHSYFGNSNAADSLLIWTRRMRSLKMHEAFRGAGWPQDKAGVPAVTIGAGMLWGQAYDAVARAGRYIQGGGCLTVGVAGFVLGGGFGSFSKHHGTGAANLLEAEVVTADGRTLIVNEHREPDLFFALKGGGGGTFGVVTRLTLRTHPLPSTIGAVQLNIRAADDDAWRDLVEHTLTFYATALHNSTWGEQLRFSPGRRLGISMLCHGLSEAQIRAVWAPFLETVKASPGRYTMSGDPLIIAVPASRFWDPDFLKQVPGVVLQDDRPGASVRNIFWAVNQGEAGQIIHAYHSAWLPSGLLGTDQLPRLTDTLIEASSIWSVSLHTNKGIGGGSDYARAATAATATNPEVLDAFALLICAAEGDPAWPGIPGHDWNHAAGRGEAERVRAAMAPIRRLVPRAGSYVSEADYFARDWQTAHWGRHYAPLRSAKRRWDPANIFRGHHLVSA